VYREEIWVSGGVAPPFLTSALVGVEWSGSLSGLFTPGEIAPNTHWIGGGCSGTERDSNLTKRWEDKGRKVGVGTATGYSSMLYCSYSISSDQSGH
jgi:hypothetical protein